MGLLLMAFMAPPAAQADELTVGDGTSTQDLGPIYDGTSSGFAHGTGYVEILYPKSLLTKTDNDMTGVNITGLTYYSNYFYFTGGTIDVQICETSNANLNSEITETPTTIATFSNVQNYYNSSTGKWTLDFGSNSFTYSGEKNLLVRLNVSAKGSRDGRCKFYCNSTYYELGSTTTVIKTTYTVTSGYGNTAYLPKTTFTYEPAAALDYDAKVTPSSLDFGSVQVNGSNELSVALKNKGTNDLTYTISGLDVPFSTTITSGTLAAGAADLEIPVTFAPTATGNFEDDLVITFGSETGLDPITVHVAGTGSDAICDGTDVNEYIPVYGYNFDDTQQINQMIYPASKIASKLNGKSIVGLTFYPATYSTGYSTYSGINFYKNSNPGTVTIKFKNLDSGTSPYESTPTRIEGATAVKTITMPTSAQTSLTEWVFEFDEGFDYTGGDLLIEVETAKGGYGHTYFYGESQTTNTGYYSNGSGGTVQPFLPKITFATEEAGSTPTISVNPATLDAFSTEVGTAVTKTVTVTGANLTGNITVAASGTGFSVSPTTITAADAANGVELTITYDPTAAGNHTATVTLSSTGAQDVTIALTGTATVVPQITVSTDALALGGTNFQYGNTDTKTFTVSNTTASDAAITLTDETGYFAVSPASVAAGATNVTVNVTYTPANFGDHTATITIGDKTVNLTGKSVEEATVNYDITVSEDNGVHNFGEIVVGGIGTWAITITNNSEAAVTPTITGLAAPFSTSYVATALAPGNSTTIIINFEPTELKEYTPLSITLTFPEAGDDFDRNYTLRGTGIADTGGTKPPTFYDGISYTWTDNEDVEHTSKLSDIATDPDQMIALMKEVYTNKTIPGSLYRGRKQDGSVDTNHPVAYPAIGTVVQNYTSGSGYSYSYGDTYGWGITNDENNYPIVHDTQSSSTYEYWALNPNEYTPDEDGLTLLLVEMKDGAQYNSVTTEPSDYASLRNTFDIMFKSVRVVTHSKKSGTGAEAGTLFKIDCDKMNRFFFLGKGRLRLYNSDIWNNTSASTYMRHKLSEGESHASSTQSESRPFYQMFEQFSPVSLTSSTGNATDIYQALVNMESYSVEHDCETIPFISANNANGHEFNLYGKESTSEDCQDIRDLMLFIPDYRMQWWYEAVNSSRDGVGSESASSDMFKNYNKSHMPTMGLYVIRQNEITGEKNQGENVYTLHLSWESNLTSFLPSAEGTYYIYQVNDDGTYTLVGTTTADVTTLDVEVAMQTYGQQVTYVIQGQDNARFLSLQMSNEESFIIPGTDPYEKFQLNPRAEIYSRYNPADEFNYYANGLQLNGYADANMSEFVGKTANFFRMPCTVVKNGNTQTVVEGEWMKVAEVNVTSATAATLANTYDQRVQSDYQYGYQQNPSSLTITTNDKGYKVFPAIYDNFKADVKNNGHADLYKYMMVVDGTPTDTENFHSNQITVKVYKTEMSTIAGTFTQDDVDGDIAHAVGLEKTAFDIDVEHSSKTEILRYGAYRWDASDYTQSQYAILDGYDSETGNELDISPNGQASNQGAYYTVYMNGDTFIGEDVYVAQGETGKAYFEDNVPDETPDLYTYAPVIETFTGRDDYNTYGAPLQSTASGKITIMPGSVVGSSYTFKPKYFATGTNLVNGTDTATCCYYFIPLTLEVNIPDGYEIYKVRAWRLADTKWLGEVKDGYQGRINGDYLYQTIDEPDKNENVIVGVSDIEGYAGSTDATVQFGAKKLGTGESFDVDFIVRAYFTKKATSKLTSADGKYYIAESKVKVTVTDNIITGILDVKGEKQVAGVKYYNLAGIESDEPFSGVNIIVTRYTDGSTSTSKVLK